jgi:alkylated DNA nucleotide flippase Atl1
MKGPTMELQRLVERVRGEFNEMPGLRLTPEQAARLWGLDARACGEVLRTLVSDSFLRWSAGSVVRSH